MTSAEGDGIMQSSEKELKAEFGLHTATAGKAKMHEERMQNERGFEGIGHEFEGIEHKLEGIEQGI
eukprot:3603761-Alexandrium_andersonii.AAC.1